ncbi:ryncolin-4-like [Physella acuta]|uniref:ryncolin-4-like n=1 Tax=Physella acuta TaxID=109671 RepID=UPI0027DDE282|nr:ryncolin-4-like [Physella acuta]
MGTLKMFAGAFVLALTVNFFPCSAELAVRQAGSLADLQTKLNQLKTTVENNQNQLQATIQQIENKLRKMPLELQDCRKNNPISYASGVQKINDILFGLCDTQTDGGGWVIIQRRVSGGVNFTKTWSEYKEGFGSQDGDFWIGNDWISRLTRMGYTQLRFDMTYNGNSHYAVYSNFKVGNETEKYKMTVGNHHGNATDRFLINNNRFFTTIDADNDGNRYGNCAVDRRGGWWYYSCGAVNLNGEWGSHVTDKGIIWESITGISNSLTFAEMKIRKV